MLLGLMSTNGVERTVLVQPILYRWDNSYTAAALRKYPDKTLAVVRSEMGFIGAEDRPWVLGKTALQLWPFAA
jgi:predicted TIM-barrel fold metal-dependent hydrolase